jgi:phasin family protein
MMNKQILDLMTQYNESVLASAKRVNELNMKTAERLAKLNTEVFNQCTEAATAYLNAISKVSDVTELAKTQAEFGKEAGEKFMANAREYAEVANAVRDEMTAISEEVVSVATANAEKAGEILKDAA